MKRNPKPALAPITVASAWPDTMGLEQAAEYLRLGRDATRELVEQGMLPAVSFNQKHLVFRRVALDAFLAATELRQMRDRARQTQQHPAANDPAPDRRPRTVKPDLRRYEADASNDPQ